MKKLITCVLTMFCALTMQATDYSGKLNVIVKDMNLNVNQESNITVNKQNDGKYELIIKDFVFGGMPVGTIDVKDVDAVENGNLTNLTFDGPTTIQANSEGGGDLRETEVNITLNAVVGDNKLGADIVINAMGMDITVNFTSAGAYIPNSDFENFHEAKFEVYTTQEADHWHSFTSAHTTSFVYNTARRQKQSFESTDVRTTDKIIGEKCLLIKSALPLNIPANGTVTTGRIQAGARKATDTKNCAFLDLSYNEKDDKGDPFYTTFTAKPDAVEFWCRFKQGQNNLSSKYASIRAVITDGTYYQDPEEDKTYSNIVAVAANKTIEGTDVWQKVTANFDYDSYKPKEDENHEIKVINPKAILVTISTNAEPGIASKDANNPDYIYIDDLSLIYNANLKSLKLNNTELFEAGKTDYTVNANGAINLSDIEVESDGNGAYISKTLEKVADGIKVTITITSNDLKKQNVYTLNIKGATTGINKPQTVTTQSGVKAVYNLSGQQVSGMSKAGVYIVERNDGTTVKVLKK